MSDMETSDWEMSDPDWDKSDTEPDMEMSNTQTSDMKAPVMVPKVPVTPLQKAYLAQEGSVFFGKGKGKFSAEIRNMIYEHLLIAHETITPDHYPHPEQYGEFDLNLLVGDKQAAGLHAGIARTCRAILYETYPILYGCNVFEFWLPHHIRGFERTGLGGKPFGTSLIACSQGRLSLIRQMSFSLHYGEPLPPRPGSSVPLFIGKPQDMGSCLKKLFSVYDNLAIEELSLDFRRSLVDDSCFRRLQEMIAEAKPDAARRGTLRNLKKLIVKGLEFEGQELLGLQDFLKPEVELISEVGDDEEKCLV